MTLVETVENYKLTEGATPDSLRLAVRNDIAKGWIPQGGVTQMLNIDSGKTAYFQAMIFVTFTDTGTV